jgi:HK97 family phage prohead protease
MEVAMQLRKTLSLTDVQLELEDERGVFSGYASKWDGVDSYGDTILKGAFSESLKTNGLPKMFFNHEWTMPIGKWTIAEEDDIGLFVKGELTPEVGISEDVYAALKHGTLDGLSVGGMIKADGYTETKTGRVISKWSNLMEISPVVFPADDSARIDFNSVKSIDFEALLPECKTERDIERLLRDAGLGKWEAMAIVSRAKAIVDGRDAQDDSEAKKLAEIETRILRLIS